MENPESCASENKKAVVWAVDPFERTIQPPAAVAARLSEWLRGAGLELQPVHILSLPKELGESRSDPMEVTRNVKAWERACDQYVRDLGISDARPARVLLSYSASRKEEVQGLLGYAESVHSPCILVSSHGRTGLNRLMMGSFAETVLLHSPAPVMFVTHFGSGHDHPREGRRSIFATDFSDKSHRAYHRYLGEARRFRCGITLVHSVTLPSLAASTIASPAVIPDDYFQSQTEWAMQEGGKWVREAEALEIRAKLVVKVDGVGANVAHTILRVAEKEEASLIAMASVSGAAASLVLGSVARDVCRSNCFPVLVYGPKVVEGAVDSAHAEQAAYA